MFLVIDKPIGITSFHVIKRVKNFFKKKIGYIGTLDPMASGVLPIAFGHSCKLIPFIVNETKEYIFTIRWGIKTNTADLTGDILEEKKFTPTRKAIDSVLSGFIGGYKQKPPIYSAIHVQGKRAYQMARKKEFFHLLPRFVSITNLKIDIHKGEETVFHVTCGKGTYIRSLTEDIAEKLGGIATVSYLRRIRVGCFKLSHAVTLDCLAREPYSAQCFLPKQVLGGTLVLQVDKNTAHRLSYGQRVFDIEEHMVYKDGIYVAFYKDELVSVVELKQGVLHPRSVFIVPGGINVDNSTI